MKSLPALVCIIALTGCGNSIVHAGNASSTPRSASTATPPPTESTRCRAAVHAADGIATQMETAVIDNASRFTHLFHRLSVLQEQVKKACTTEVDEPFSEGVYSLALANAHHTACEFVELCNKKEVERDLVDGTTLIHDAAAVATRAE